MLIPKASKSSHIGPKASFRLKDLERLIDLYLRSNINRSLLSRSQHTYIKGKSVESALHDVTGFVEADLARCAYTLPAFLVIEAAFNNVTTSSIESSLSGIHAPDFLVRFITYVLGNILIQSNIGRCLIVKRTIRGAIPSFVVLGC